MPITSVTRDAAHFTLTVVADFPVPRQRLWDAFADPRQLERFWGPPSWPATFTLHDFRKGGRAEYYLTAPDGKQWSGSWMFTEVNPISSFAADDGDDNVDDPNMPASMTFVFETRATGSRMTCVTRFASLEAMEQTADSMEEGFRAAFPQLDALLAQEVSVTARAR
jgi:uncharacterized protein YndB with AHSA1/START domain